MTPAKILIVEDDPDLRRGLALRLRASGYAVVAAEDGVSAVSVAVRERPDLILLDLGLPGGDGITVLERYANLPMIASVPVVVLTGRDAASAGPAVAKYHVAAFLQKPADNQALLDAISGALLGGAALTGGFPEAELTPRPIPGQQSAPQPSGPPPAGRHGR